MHWNSFHVGLLCCLAAVGNAQTGCNSPPTKGFIPGNITIGFIFPFFGPSDDGRGCSTAVPSPDNIQLIEAAIQIVNSINAGSMLPGISLGLEAWDSCHLSSIAVDRSIAYLNEKTSNTGNDGSVCSSASLFAGMIGLSDTEPASAVAAVLNEAKTPFVSYGASFINHQTHDYLLRTVPSDAMDVEVIVKLLVYLKWTYVYTYNSADESNIAASNHFKMLAKVNGICISSSKNASKNSPDSVFNSVISSFSEKPNSPNIVVLFSSADDSVKLFKAANSISKKLQWVIGRQVLTEKIGLQQEVKNVTQGLIGVVPRTLNTQVMDFISSFNKIPVSSSDSRADPWFADYSQQSDFTQNEFVAPLQNAFLLYANALHNAQTDKCVSSGPCDAMWEMSSEELMSYLTNSSFSGVNNTWISFSETRQMLNQSYDIVNIAPGADTQYGFNIVGNFANNNLTLTKNLIHYGADGLEISSMCNSSCTDLACGETEDSTQVYIPGNVIIGGMFGVHQSAQYPASSGCGNISADGIQQLEALLYALDLLNSDSEVLPNITVGVDAFDTCNSASHAGSQAIKLVGGAEFGGTGSGQRTDESGKLEHIYGIVGPGTDDECLEVLNVIGVYDVPDISYAAQTAKLSNTYTYPTFARTVSVETMPVAAIIEILVAKRWTYVQAIITPNTYGWNSYSVLSQQAPSKGICVIQSQMPNVAASMDTFFDEITKENAPNVTILFTEESDTYRFLKEITTRNLNGRFYIIAASKWTLNNKTDEIKDGLKGLTAVTMRDRVVTGFRDYYTKLKPSTNKRNPWFREYWSSKFNCNFTENSNNMCTDEMKLTNEDVTNPYVGEVIDSLYAMAHAVDTLHGAKCPLETSVCYEMTKASGSELFINLRNVNFESKNEDKKIVYFNFQGDGSSDYDVFNYQEVGSTFKYVKIGSYSNKLEINATMLKYYDHSGNVASNDGNACEGSCDGCVKVEKEKVAEVANGDVWIGGYFELNQPGNDRINCLNELLLYNMQHLEAFLWSIDQINKDNTILPDINIGAIGFDTCGLPEKARRDVTNFVSKAVEYRSGFPKNSIRVMGIIGGETSDSSIEIADVTTPLSIPQISYAATTEVLNNVTRYPYFMRTVPTDSDQALALVDIINYFDWRYVSVVYSEDGYGVDMLREFSKFARKSNICIAMKVKIELNSTIDNFDRDIKTLLSNLQAQVVVLLTSDLDTKQLLEAAERQSVTNIQWLGTETWGSRNFIIENANITSQRAITLRFSETVAEGFKSYFTTLNPYYNYRNPWFSRYWMDTFKCNLNLWNVELKYDTICSWALSLADDYEEEPEVTYIANAVKAFAIGLDETMKSLCPEITNYVCQEVYDNTTLLKDNILSAQFEGFGGQMFSFDAEGNGPPKFDILNFVGDAYNTIGKWNATLTWNGTELKTQFKNVVSECVGRCSECSSEDDIKMAIVDGELQIPALFAVHEHLDYTNGCGRLRDTGIVNLEAFLFALDEVNRNSSLLPGVKLGTTAFDTCMTGSRAVREVSSLLGGLLEGSNGWSSIIGIIGSESDDATKSLTAVSEQYRYTQVSYGASSNAFNDVDEYPYLLRMLPSSSVLVQVAMDIIKYFKWDGVHVIYSDTAENKTNLELFVKTARDEGICIQDQIVPRGGVEADFIEIVKTISDTDSPSAVLLFTTISDTENIQQQATKITRHVTWIEAGSLGRKLPDKSNVTDAVLGSFYVEPAKSMQIQEFTQYFENLTGTTNARNPWFAEYIGTGECGAGLGVPCTSPAQLLNDENTLMATIVIESVRVMAGGIDSLLKSTCTGPGVCAEFLMLEPNHILKAIKESSFKDSASDQMLQFTDEGYIMRSFDIFNYQDDSFVKVGNWSNNSQLNLDAVELYGDDGKLTNEIFSKCKERPLTTNSPKQTTKKQEETPNSLKQSSDKSVTGNVFYVIVIFCLIGIVATVAIMFYFFLKRKTSLVSTYSYSLCILMLISILGLFIVPLLFGIEASNSVCGFQHFMIGIMYAARSATALLMSIRLLRIGRHERRISGEKTTHTNDSSQIIFFCCLMFVEVMLIAEWVVIEPLEKLYISGADEVFKCFYDMDGLAVSFIYTFIMLVVTIGITIWSRMKVDLAYHPQIIGIMISTIGTVITFVVWILAAVLTNKEEDIPIFISFGSIVTATINLLVIFPPKILHIYKKYDPRFDDTASILSRSSSISSPASRYVEPRSTSSSNVVVENPGILGDLKEEENTGV